MNNTKLILITFLLALSLNQLFAQSHNLSPGSLCKFSKTHTVSDSRPCPACDKTDADDKNAKMAEDQRRMDERITFGALAVDRNNGFYYGWAYDYATLAEAEKKAVDECIKKGGDCSVVLSFSGDGCAAYRTINGNVGTAFGWGLAATKEAADAIAQKECMKRSKGVTPSNHVWTCNSLSKVALKEIYNAKDEISDFADTTPLGSVHACAFSSDGKKFATGSSDGIVRIWSMPSFNLIGLLNTNAESKYNYGVQEIVFSADGKLLATGTGNNGGKVKIWDVASRKLVKTLEYEWGNSPAISFSPDGKWLAFGGDCSWNGESCPTTIYVYDVTNWQLMQTYNGHSNNIRSSSFSTDSKTLATSGIDGTVIFWNTLTGSKIRSITVTSDQVAEGHFSPDGKTFVTITWSVDSKIKLWDHSTGKLIKTLPGHGVFGESISYYLGSNKVISIGSQDGGTKSHFSTMILWDLNNASQISYATIGFTGWKIAVSPDGTIATTGPGGLSLWKLNNAGNLTLIKSIE